MVTGTFAFPKGYPSGPTPWPTTLQNPYNIALVSQHFSHRQALPNDNSHTASTRPPQPSQEVSGYLHSQGKARDSYHGKCLVHILRAKDVDIENAPPFEPVTDKASYANHGVVKINNIPFTVSTQEITQFITRFSPIPMLKKHDSGYPIHIIMEKPTGKTMDCYVEFPSHEAAVSCIRRFEHTAHPGRGTKLGTRNVSLDLSNQAELMEAVFPRARLVEFDVYNGQPHIISRDHDPSWSAGFRGYFTLEEIYGITRFAECPSRSPFVLKCHQRVYESMITTLYKFPWAATKTYTIRARNALFESAYKQLNILSRKVGCPIGPPSDISSMIRHGYNEKGYAPSMHALACDPMEVRMNNREVGLSQSLLFDLLFAAVNVPAFNLLQKLALCQSAGSYGRGIPLHSFSETWPYQTLEPAPGTPDHVIKFWLELFDTGYDIMTASNEPTGFESQIVFTRNKVGFPIAEWTSRGIELPFEDATRVERAAMMCYLSRGRQAWAAERQINVRDWKTNTLEGVMTQIAIERHAERQSDRTQKSSRSKSFADAEERAVSPRTTGCFRYGSDEQQKRVNELGPIGSASPKKDSRLNAASAIDFVPSSVNDASSSEGGVGIDTSSTELGGRPFMSNIEISKPAVEPNTNARPQKLRINTNVANTNANRYASPEFTSSGTTANFTNPFSAQPEPKAEREPLSSAAISPREAPSQQTAFTHASPIAKHRKSIVLTGVSRPTPSRAPARAQSQLNSAVNDVGEQMRSLSMATTAVKSPHGCSTRDPEVQYPPSFSSGEEVAGGLVDDPFGPPKRMRTHTVPDIAVVHRTHNYDFGPVGSGSGHPNATSGSRSVAVAVGSGEQKMRAQSIPIIPDTSAAVGAGYTQGAHRSAYAYAGPLSATELWSGIGESGRRYR